MHRQNGYASLFLLLGNRSSRVLAKSPETVVVQAVRCEPVSASDTLLTGKRSGNSRNSDHTGFCSRPKAQIAQSLTQEFPAQRNREFERLSSERVERNRQG